MIKHVALSKYKEFAEGCSKEENMKKAKALTEGLLKKIPEIRKLEIGVNILPEGEHSFDTATCSEYENMDAVNRTLSHPAHVELVAFMGKVLEEGYAVTYEI